MSYRKYLQDYQIEEYVTEKGRVRKRAVYSAGYYALTPAIPRGAQRLILLFSLLSWVLLVGALSFNTDAARLWYVVLPFVLSIFPMYFMTSASISILFSDVKLTRERAQKISRSFPASPLIIAILSGIAFLGLVITALFHWKDIPVYDIIFAALSLAVAGAAAYIFKLTRLLKTQPVEDDR